MLSLMFGLASALSWAVHDLLVRKLAQGGSVLPMMLVVVSSGCIAMGVVAMVWGGWGQMTPAAYGLAVATGVAYVVGMLGLYRAFQIAPVRIVAPVLGSFPMISLGIAAWQGAAVGVMEWGAVLAIVAGITVVALHSADESSGAQVPLLPALCWAAFGAVGFALTFALGQEAARQGAVVPTILVARVVSAGVIALMVLLARAPVGPVRGSLRLLALMGVLDATALALVQAAARLPHPEYASVASSLFGVLTILLAWRFLGEKVQRLQWAGIAVVFAGIGVLSAQG
jgi:drug/metabolite transporter (DMT)-like permease